MDELGREAFITNNPLQMLRKVGGVGGAQQLCTSCRVEQVCCAGLQTPTAVSRDACRLPTYPTVPALPSLCSQALTLRRIAVYFDTDSEFWAPEAPWRDLAPHDWDEWFLPGIRCVPVAACHSVPLLLAISCRLPLAGCLTRTHGSLHSPSSLLPQCTEHVLIAQQEWCCAARTHQRRPSILHISTRSPSPCSSGRQERGGTARTRQYVLQPVDGQARYTRRGAGVQAKGGPRAGGWVCPPCFLQGASALLSLPSRHTSQAGAHRFLCGTQSCRRVAELPFHCRVPDLPAEDEPVLELDFQLNDVAVCLTRELPQAATAWPANSGGNVGMWKWQCARPVPLPLCCASCCPAGVF